jgi:hypothetical protein
MMQFYSETGPFGTIVEETLNVTFFMCSLLLKEGNKKLFISHMGALQKQFSSYFKDTYASNLSGLETHLLLTTSLDYDL